MHFLAAKKWTPLPQLSPSPTWQPKHAGPNKQQLKPGNDRGKRAPYTKSFTSPGGGRHDQIERLTQGKTGYWQRSLKLRPARVLRPMRYSKLLMRRRCHALSSRCASAASELPDGHCRQTEHIKHEHKTHNTTKKEKSVCGSG